MPRKISEVTALSCTKAGNERGSEAGTRRWLAKLKRDAMAGRALISWRNWSSTPRHSTRMAEIDGVLNSSAEAPGRGKNRAASQQLKKLTTVLFTAPLGPFCEVAGES